MVYVSTMPTRQAKLRRAQLLAAASRNMAANSGARRGPPGRGSRALPIRRQAAFDKSTRRNVGQIQRHRNPIPKGLSRRHHFDAFGPQNPQALAFSIGPATQISGAFRFPLALSSANTFTLLAFQPGSGFHQAIYTTQGNNGVWTADGNPSITSTGIDPAAGASATSPDHIMCSRGSIRIRNLTAAGSVASAVHILRVSTGLTNFYGTPSDSEAIKDLILESKDTCTMSGSELTGTHQWDCIPVSQTNYHDFISPDNHVSKLLDPGVSTILILFEHPSSSNQDYELSMAATYYARYRITGPLANAAGHPPTLSLDLINMLRDGAEQLGSLGMPLLKSGVRALKNEAETAIPGMLGNLFRQNAGFPALTNTRLMPLAL